MAAILRRAVFDFVYFRNPKHSKHALAIDAAGWLFWDGEDPEAEHERWSFLRICNDLGLRPKNVRELCLTLKPADLKSKTYLLKEEE